MREAERQRDAATEYAKSVEEKEKLWKQGLKKLMLITLKSLKKVSTGLEGTKRISCSN